MSCDHILEIIKSTAGNSTAKLIAVLEALGITSTAELAAHLGLTMRAVQKAINSGDKAMLAKSEQEFASPLKHSEPEFACDVSTANQSSPKSEPEFAYEPKIANQSSPSRTRDKELISITKVLPSGEGVVGGDCAALDGEVMPPLSASAAKAERSSSKTVRGSRLSSEWELPDEWRAWARETFPGATDAAITFEADKFRDYWVSKSTQAAKLDWLATWRNWCRTGLARAAKAQSAPSWVTERNDKAKALMAMLNTGSTAI